MGMVIQRAGYPSPADVEPYHRAVRMAIDAVPARIDAWVGTDGKVPASAVALLKPNRIVSRCYVNTQSLQQFNLLIVHCRDARDLAGHYPPNCYPSAGWTARGARACEWQIDDWHVTGMRYEFRKDLVGHDTVVNLLILPDGTLVRDMNAVRRLAADYRTHFYGAAQIQLVFPESMPERTRSQVTRRVLRELRPVVDAIASREENG
jgi:hypothetical protein